MPNLRARAHEAEVAWILGNSFPVLGTAELSRRLRSAGYPLGSANISEHEAIAATQAAIWRFTNDLELDNRPRNVPIAVRRTGNRVFFEFDGELELGGYTVQLASDAALSLMLQKSVDGLFWSDVAASGLNFQAGEGTLRKALGVGSTLSESRHGRRGTGFRFYRLHILADPAARVDVGEVSFWLTGAGNYRNPDRIVHLYDHLLAGARSAHDRVVLTDLVSGDAMMDDGLVGPFRLHAASSAKLSLRDGAIVDADGMEFAGHVESGTEFYIRPPSGTDGVLVTATVPGSADGFGGRVVTGVARDDVNSRLTPVALASPAPVVVDFAVYWATRRRI